MGGRACIRGMRIPVSVVVGQIAHGATMEEVLSDYPALEHADIAQALAYTATRKRCDLYQSLPQRTYLISARQLQGAFM